MNFASAGTASTSYLAGEIFKQVAKIDIVHIPYKGAPEAMKSILRNDTQIYFVSANASRDLIEAKKIKVMAVSSAKRFPQLPNVPTVGESGLPDYVYEFLVRRDGAGRACRRRSATRSATTSRACCRCPTS